MKLKEKLEAVKLREDGRSCGEIRNKLRVSKSTLSLWLRNIELTSEQKNRLYVTLKQKHAYRLAKIKQEEKRKRTENIIIQAEKEADAMLRDPLFLSGLMLYIGRREINRICEKQ